MAGHDIHDLRRLAGLAPFDAEDLFEGRGAAQGTARVEVRGAGEPFPQGIYRAKIDKGSALHRAEKKDKSKLALEIVEGRTGGDETDRGLVRALMSWPRAVLEIIWADGKD